MSWVYRRPFDYRPQNRLGHGFRAILYAAGSMAGVASITTSSAANLGGTANLAAAESLTLTASAVPISTNPNELIGSAPLQFGRNALLRGTGALLAAEPLTFSGSATLSGTNSFQPGAWPKRRRWDLPRFDYHQWDNRRWTIFPYSVNTQTAGIGSVAISGNALIRGTGRLIGVTAPRFTGSGSMVGAGSLAGNVSAFSISGSGTLLDGADGSITADGGWGFSVTGTLTGSGAMYGPADLRFTVSATSQVLVPPSGNANPRFGATGTLRNASAGAGEVTAMSFSTTDGLQMFFSA
jgi:hypothetical protein